MRFKRKWIVAPSVDNGVEEECPLFRIQAINNRKRKIQCDLFKKIL